MSCNLPYSEGAGGRRVHTPEMDDLPLTTNSFQSMSHSATPDFAIARTSTNPSLLTYLDWPRYYDRAPGIFPVMHPILVPCLKYLRGVEASYHACRSIPHTRPCIPLIYLQISNMEVYSGKLPRKA